MFINVKVQSSRIHIVAQVVEILTQSVFAHMSIKEHLHASTQPSATYYLYKFLADTVKAVQEL